MPNRLSKAFTRSSKEEEAEGEHDANTKPGSSSPPPEYTQETPNNNYDQENVLQPPDVTAGFSNLTISEKHSLTPQVDQCIAHLKVLECFYRLRQKIGSTDGMFRISDSIVLDKGLDTSDSASEALAKLSEKRWAIYVSRAVDRFAIWSAAIDPKARMLRRANLEAIGEKGKLCEPDPANPRLAIGTKNMPPVDVLVVWHAYMLNPRDYLSDCLRSGRMATWHTEFPWQAAVDCINSETFAYENAEAEKNFTSLTGLPWNQLDDAAPKVISCPACRNKMEVEYSTVPQLATATMAKRYHSWQHLSKDLDDVLSNGSGFCDKTFLKQCSKCEGNIDHDWLQAGKFCNDVRLLLYSDVPMNGTILGPLGVPIKYKRVKEYMYKSTNKFPNDLLKGWLGQKIVDALSNPSNGIRHSMEEVRYMIEEGLTNGSYLRSVNKSLTSSLNRMQKTSIRRMMTHYWDNSGPFALDLVGAVIRQGSFIEKMHNIDWLHSPALPNTMTRLITKYLRFVSIMKDNTQMAVPTLDVDLAWHTHQLSPPPYLDYTTDTTKQFIDHDDKVAETKLNDSFAWTSKRYQRLYGEPYSECTCWYCEAIRESHTSGASRLFGGGNARAEEQLHSAEQDPRKSVHISTHNAVRPDDKVYNATASRKAEELEREFQKACERAKKKGKKEPKRDDYYYSDAWGYPVYIPAYSPYIGFYPYAYAGMYCPVAPGCMALGAGEAGNCCAGTCGGAAGACGGAGAACAGGAGGAACGGGGGGGGCGGGGGGGGGGGCGGGGGGGGGGG